MSVIDMVNARSGTELVLAVIVVLMTLIQVTPIQINPWDALFRWLGGKFNKGLFTRIDILEQKLDEHIEGSNEERIRKVRADILDFGNACMNHRAHTKEEFEFVISECDQYEQHIRKLNQPNGVATATIAEIRRLYEKGIRENSFLKEGGEDDE